MTKKHHFHLPSVPVLYLTSSLVLIFFSVMTKYLTIHFTCSDVRNVYVIDYLFSLFTAGAVILALYFFFRYLRHFPRIRRRLVTLACFLLTGWNLFCTWDHASHFSLDMTSYFQVYPGWNHQSFSVQELIWEAYDKSRFIGAGESMYDYPDPEILSQQEELQALAINERRKFDLLTDQWDKYFLLPGLSMHCGYWIVPVYLGIIAAWFASVFLGWKQIPSEYRFLYLSCFLPVALPLLGPALGALGLLRFYSQQFLSLSEWQNIMTGGLLQLVLVGRFLWQTSEPIPAELQIPFLKKLLICEKILVGEAVLSESGDIHYACNAPENNL